MSPIALDRPRQIVSEEFGKPAPHALPGIGTDFRKTTHRLLSPNRTYPPATGTRRPSPRPSLPHPWRRALRTKAERLYLHAEYLAFTHPITSERIEMQKITGIS